MIPSDEQREGVGVIVLGCGLVVGACVIAAAWLIVKCCS